jgi:hypothetical protein
MNVQQENIGPSLYSKIKTSKEINMKQGSSKINASSFGCHSLIWI